MFFQYNTVEKSLCRILRYIIIMHYVLFFLALIAAFIPAAADTYVVDIDDVSRVELDIDGTPVTGLKNGSNSIDMGSAKYLRVTAK